MSIFFRHFHVLVLTCNGVTRFEDPPIRQDKNLSFFWGVPGQDINWTHFTPWASADHHEIMNMAHRHGARTMIDAPKIENLTALEFPLQQRNCF